MDLKSLELVDIATLVAQLAKVEKSLHVKSIYTKTTCKFYELESSHLVLSHFLSVTPKR
jgi:hypothetical protein